MTVFAAASAQAQTTPCPDGTGNLAVNASACVHTHSVTSTVNDILLLGRRSVREIVKLPAATLPGLFIPLFFLAVNIGQVSKTFNSARTFGMLLIFVLFCVSMVGLSQLLERKVSVWRA